jgi:1-deoxy-D-xylulose-5-phosphate synthase
VRIGWPDRFIEHGKIDALRAKYGLTVDAAMEKLAPYLAVRNSEMTVRSAKTR